MWEVACDRRHVGYDATNMAKGPCNIFLTKIYSFLFVEIGKARRDHLTYVLHSETSLLNWYM